jgi:creatinine amidohydrolase
MSLPRFWSQLTTRDFAALDPAATVAVLPLGATEQHGPHLPLGVDSTLVDGIVSAAVPLLPAELPVLFLPSQPIGLSPEHASFPGTLTL